MDSCGFAVGVSRHDALAEGFQAAHLCFDPVSGVVFGPTLPECSDVVSRCAQRFVAGACRRAVIPPWPRRVS